MLKVQLARNGAVFREMIYPLAMGVDAVTAAAELVAVQEGFNESGDVNVTISGPSAVMRAWLKARGAGWSVQPP